MTRNVKARIAAAKATRLRKAGITPGTRHSTTNK